MSGILGRVSKLIAEMQKGDLFNAPFEDDEILSEYLRAVLRGGY
jgi:hypothetical protein